MKTQIKQAKDWQERYRLLILAGKNLPRPSDDELAAMEEIHGCEARLWFQSTLKNDRTFAFAAYSEARIMNGLLWLLLQEIHGSTAERLAHFDIRAFFADLGIAQRLSESRLNGLTQIGERLCSLPTSTSA